jgi:hypothetical protein
MNHIKEDEFNVIKLCHEDFVGLPNEIRNKIYGTNDYETDKYVSELWKSINKEPIEFLKKMVDLKIFEIGTRKIKYTRQFKTSLIKSYSDYEGEKVMSDFENDLERRRIAVKIHTKRLGLEKVEGMQLTHMALLLLIKSGFWMMDYNNNGDFFVPRRWEREEFQVSELLRGRPLL